MTIGEAKNRARGLWGDAARIQVLPARFQIIVPSKEKGKFVLVGEGDDWYSALADSKAKRDELATGVLAAREKKSVWRRIWNWVFGDVGGFMRFFEK